MRSWWGLCILSLATLAPCHADTAMLGTVKTAVTSLSLSDMVPRDSKGLQSGKFTIGSETYTNLWVLPGQKGTFFTLDLGQGSPYTALKLTLRPFMAYAGYTGPVAIEILGDNRRIYGQSFTGEQTDIPLSLDVSNVRTLTVKVDPVCASDDTLNPRALSVYLAGASFERTPATTPTTGIAPAPVRCRVAQFVQDTPYTPPRPLTPPPPRPVRARW